MTEPKSVAIVGGGISGLSAAYYLSQMTGDVHCRLYEASHRLGGMLRTTRSGGWLIESSADNFLAGDDTRYACELAEQIGFADQLIETNEQNRRAMVAMGGHLHPVPRGFQLMGTTGISAVLDSTLLTRSGRLRLARERSIPPRTDGVEESLAEFATRRLGVEAYECLVQPLVAGIYSANPTKLSVEAALPRFTSMEREHGSIYEGLLVRRNANKNHTAASGARYGMFLTPRDGMESFVDAIHAALPAQTCVTRMLVTSIAPVDPSAPIDPSSPVSPSDRRASDHSVQKWRISFADHEPQVVDSVIVALPAHRVPSLLSFNDQLAAAFSEIEYSSVVVACAGYHRDQFHQPPSAFGIVVPQIEGRRIIAISFSSVKFPGRAPDGHELLRVFVGGACQAELTELDDTSLTGLVRAELAEIVGVTGEPELFSIHRWQKSSPQYHIGHTARVEKIESEIAKWPGLFVAGNAYHGVGIPQSIASGKECALRLGGKEERRKRGVEPSGI